MQIVKEDSLNLVLLVVCLLLATELLAEERVERDLNSDKNPVSSVNEVNEVNEKPSVFQKAKSFVFGPNAKELKKIPLPEEFVKSDLKVEEKLKNGNLIYIRKNNESYIKSLKNLYVYIRSKKTLCKLQFISEEKRRILASLEKCKDRDQVFLGDGVLPESTLIKTNNFFKERKNYAGLHYKMGTGEITSEGNEFGGDLQSYGLDFSLSFQPFLRVIGDYSVGNITPKAPMSSSSEFIGFSALNINLLAEMPESIWFSIWGIQFKPLIGGYSSYEIQDGAPRFNRINIGLSFGLNIEKKSIKTKLEWLVNYCLVQCNITEIGSSGVYFYSSSKSLKFRLRSSSKILPWENWSLLTLFDYELVTSSSASVDQSTENSRDFSQNNLKFGLGLAYHF